MTTKNLAETDVLPAEEVPNAGLSALSGAMAGSGQAARPGWAMYIGGDCLKPGSKHWNEGQRENGIWVKGVYLEPSEEEEAYDDAGRAGRSTDGSVGPYIVRRTLAAIADNIKDADGKDAPGPWRPIPYLERVSYWAELGTVGRNFYTQSYQMAHTATKESRKRAADSFRQLL